MTGFWISAAAMVLLVAGLVVQAVRQADGSDAAAEGEADLAVYRDQLAEIDRDLARGVLASDEAQRLRLEVQRRMLSADRLRQGGTAPGHWTSRVFVVLALALCLGGAAAIYSDLGVLGYPDLPLQTRLAMADQTYLDRPHQAEAEAAQPRFVQSPEVEPELAAMIEQLRAAVAARPGDLVGLSLLARNEAALGNFVAARAAQDEVVALKAGQATGEDLALLAQVMILAAGGIVTPEAEAVLIRCLTIDPKNGWARYYSGLMFAEIGRPDKSFALWEPLLREGPPDAPWTAPVRSLIEEVAAAAGIEFALPTLGPDAADLAAAAEMSEADRAAMIATMVAGLEARLQSEGGTVEDWGRLITSLGVLQERDRAVAAFRQAKAAFASKPGELAALQVAAKAAGVAE